MISLLVLTAKDLISYTNHNCVEKMDGWCHTSPEANEENDATDSDFRYGYMRGNLVIHTRRARKSGVAEGSGRKPPPSLKCREKPARSESCSYVGQEKQRGFWYNSSKGSTF